MLISFMRRNHEMLSIWRTLIRTLEMKVFKEQEEEYWSKFF